MNNGIASGERGTERFRIEQVAGVRLACDGIEVGEIAGLADQKAQLGPFGGEGARHVMADKSGCAGDKDPHLVPRVFSLNACAKWRCRKVFGGPM